MILADTSAWVEYDRASESPAERRLSELIAGEGPVAISEPIVMEVVAGARTADAKPISADSSCASISCHSTRLPTSTGRRPSTASAAESALPPGG